MMFDLEGLAIEVLKKRGLSPLFPSNVMKQLQRIPSPAFPTPQCQDLRSLLLCSIDNETSRDLDQLTYAKKNPDHFYTLWVAVADVDALVPKNSPIDLHAKVNTTSIYTPAKVFPMLPEKLSYDWTSLNEQEDRLALMIKMECSQDGRILHYSLSQAVVRNHAKLAYPSVGAWLEKKGPIPEKVEKIPGLKEALLCQHELAQHLQNNRELFGALTLHPSKIEARVTKDEQILLEPPYHNAAHQLIEAFMIAANHTIALYLQKASLPSFRRIVRTPKRWERIVQIAAQYGFSLPEKPNAKLLQTFLLESKKKDPESFPDLSLVIVKLLGRGEYVVETPQSLSRGHFGLSLSEYTHSTAPNRRFPDLLSLRQCKALLLQQQNPYTYEELLGLAEHCTKQEDAAIKAERHLNKSAAALLLSSQIGTRYQGIITGASEKGTYVRIFSPPVEGRIIQGHEKLDVGDRIQVELISVDVPLGFINFKRSV